jgi:hypothetical protein
LHFSQTCRRRHGQSTATVQRLILSAKLFVPDDETFERHRGDFQARAGASGLTSSSWMIGPIAKAFPKKPSYPQSKGFTGSVPVS